jgi:hypothetical protein
MAKQWGELSPAYRDRLARGFGKEGLTRDQVRGRYNRGTLGPVSAARGHAATPERPSDVIRNPQRYRDYLERQRKTVTGTGITKPHLDAMRTKYVAVMDRLFGERFKYNRNTVVHGASKMTYRQLRVSLDAEEESNDTFIEAIEMLASQQASESKPNFYNVWWYR